MSSSTQPTFRIDVAINDLLMHSASKPPAPPAAKGATLPEPAFPHYPEKLLDPGPETPPETREWTNPTRQTRTPTVSKAAPLRRIFGI